MEPSKFSSPVLIATNMVIASLTMTNRPALLSSLQGAATEAGAISPLFSMDLADFLLILAFNVAVPWYLMSANGGHGIKMVSAYFNAWLVLTTISVPAKMCGIPLPFSTGIGKLYPWILMAAAVMINLPVLLRGCQSLLTTPSNVSLLQSDGVVANQVANLDEPSAPVQAPTNEDDDAYIDEFEASPKALVLVRSYSELQRVQVGDWVVPYSVQSVKQISGE